MRKPLIFLIIFILLINISVVYSNSINLIHLTKEQYVRQIEQGTDSAYTELGMKKPDSKYNGNTFEWIVKLINSVIDENFSAKIIHSNDMPVDMCYQVVWKRSNKNITFSLVCSIIDERLFAKHKFYTEL